MTTTVIGIDPGTHTGIAVKDLESGKFILIATMQIHRALKFVESLHPEQKIFVVIEDARQRKWIEPKAGREKLQGVGSVKRDCAIWEDFLQDVGIPYKMTAPAKNKTKWPMKVWQAATGWKARTSEHARDAAILIHGINSKTIQWNKT